LKAKIAQALSSDAYGSQHHPFLWKNNWKVEWRLFASFSLKSDSYWLSPAEIHLGKNKMVCVYLCTTHQATVVAGESVCTGC
jgi:hypothetical protein